MSAGRQNALYERKPNRALKWMLSGILAFLVSDHGLSPQELQAQRVASDSTAREILAARFGSCTIRGAVEAQSAVSDGPRIASQTRVHLELTQTPEATAAITQGVKNYHLQRMPLEAEAISTTPDTRFFGNVPAQAIDASYPPPRNVTSITEGDNSPEVIFNLSNTRYKAGTSLAVFVLSKVANGIDEQHTTVSTGHTYCGTLTAASSAQAGTAWTHDKSAPTQENFTTTATLRIGGIGY